MERDVSPLTEIQGIRYEKIRSTRKIIASDRSVSMLSKHATAGIWNCFEGRPCEDLELVDVHLTSRGDDDWSCSHVGRNGTRVDDVSPSGLSVCLGVVD